MEGAPGAASGSGLPPSQSQSQLLFGVSPPDITTTPPLTVDAISDSQQVEAASPISSRPPAASSLNYEELIRLSGSGGGGGGQMAVDDDAGDDADRSGGGGGNRWPRQETLALLKIRSDMDSAFRDATLKGPLWDEVSRKLAELGYNRSAKKCKEKFENVQKYYKRTKEGRGGRQDGKTYKFFTQLEALHNANAANAAASVTTTTTTPNVAPSFSVPTPVSVGFGISNPTPISSVKISPASQTPMGIFSPADHFTVRPPTVAAPTGVSFSSNTSSASTEDEEDDDENEDMGFDVDLEGEPSSVAGTSRKRRRRGAVKGSGGSSSASASASASRTRSQKMMMEFFEGLMKQVMHKQEVMQQKFLEAIEKREQDRMIREETWKRQEMGRLSREQERMAQERTISASRDAAIIAFLQKFTGQTIQLPAVNNISPNYSVPQQQQFDVPAVSAVPAPIPMPMPAPMPATVSVPAVPLSPVAPPPLQPQNQNTTIQASSNTMRSLELDNQPTIISYQDQDGSASEPISSRWPKPEVLALIKLRGGLESRYQETGPKGPLWEEISAGMQRMGYKRSSKRCKEKWENINKYFKKVKESNKKRREDSKTCPYFDELDALYRKKSTLSGGGSSGFSDTTVKNMDMDMDMEITPPIIGSSEAETQPQSQTTLAEGLSASLFGEATDQEPATKPEDIVNELMELQDLYNTRPAGDNNTGIHRDDDEEDEEDDCSDDDDNDNSNPDEKRNNNNMDYKIEFQRRNVGNSNGVGSTEFQSMAVVQ